jgi:hypothetical protein
MQLATCYFVREDPRLAAVGEELIALGRVKQLLSSANERAVHGDGAAALTRVLAFLERGEPGEMELAMAMDVIGVALGTDGYTVEALALCLFSDRALDERGYVPYRGELPILRKQRRRARRELTAAEVAEAERLADELDLARARDLGVRLAEERLQRIAGADRATTAAD